MPNRSYCFLHYSLIHKSNSMTTLRPFTFKLSQLQENIVMPLSSLQKGRYGQRWGFNLNDQNIATSMQHISSWKWRRTTKHFSYSARQSQHQKAKVCRAFQTGGGGSTNFTKVRHLTDKAELATSS